MSNRKSNYDKALQTSRRQFLKSSLSVAVGLGASSLIGLPTLAKANTNTGGGPVIGPSPQPYSFGAPTVWQPTVTQGLGTYNALSGNHLISYSVACADALDFIIYHNSLSTITSGPLGAKWSHSFSGHIVTGVGTASYIAGDGSTYPFNLSGSTYIAPIGYRRSLVHNGDGTWTLTDLQGTLCIHFLSTGALDSVRITSTGAVLIQCNYTSGTLTSVTKGAESLLFGYTGTSLTSVTDLLGNVHTLTYTSGVLTEHSLPALTGMTSNTQFAYSAAGIVNQITDRDSNVTAYTYNTGGTLASTTDPLSHTTTYLCGNANPGPSGWPSDVVCAGVITKPGGADQYGFDSSGRIVAYAGVSDKSVYSYDSNNNLTLQTLASSGTWTWTYDSVGRVLTETSPSGVADTYTRDSGGRITAETIGGVTPATGTYDSNSNLTQIIMTGGHTLTLGYDANFNPTSCNDTTSGTSMSATYDSNNNLTSFTNAMGYTISFSYTNNLVMSITDARGRVTTITRDAWGRETGRTFPTTSHTSESCGYNSLSNLVAGTNAAGSYSYIVNGFGLRTSKTGPEGTVSATFDTSNRPSTVTDTASRSHTLTWGTNSAITSIALNDGTGTVLYTYNSDNQLLSCTLPNGTVIQYGYDTAARLASVTNKVVSSGTVLVSYAGTFLSTGMLSQITESPSGAITAFTYDSVGRITLESRTGTSAYQGSYTYDGMGRVLTAIRSESGVTSHHGTYTYSSAGLLTQVVDSVTGLTEIYTHYNDGTLASFPGPSYTRKLDYYEDGKLLSISRDSGSGPVLAYKFAYDPDGCLAWYEDHVLGTFTEFVCGTGQLAGSALLVNRRPLAAGSWTEIARFIQGINSIVAVSGSYFAGALVGGPFLATNSSAVSSGTCLFDSFGVVRFSSGVLTSLPGRLVLDGITITVPTGAASILERYLTVC